MSLNIIRISIKFTTIFNQAWLFSAVKEKDSDDKNEYTNLIGNFANCVANIQCAAFDASSNPLQSIIK